MSNITHSDGTIDYIELLCESGFYPMDDAEELVEDLDLPDWVKQNFEAITVIADGHFLVAGIQEDELVLTRFAPNSCSTDGTMSFRVDDDCSLDELQARAFQAVSAAWSKP